MKDKTDNIVKIESGNRTPPPKTQLSQTFKKVHRLFLLGLKPGISEFFNNLDDMLFSMAEKAENNEKQNQYFDAMREVRQCKESLLKQFTDNITQVFALFAKRKYAYFSTKTNTTDSETLSLVDEEELDLKLASNQLISKAQTYHHQNLHALKVRFSALAGGHKLNVEEVPVSPSVIVHSFAQSISSLESNSTVKIIVIKLLERSLVSILSQVYDEINAYLAEQGICPNIKFSTQQPRGARQVTGNQQQGNTSSENPTQENAQQTAAHSSNDSNNAYTEDYEAIMQFLNQRHVNDSGFNGPPAEVLNNAEISQGLNKLQTQFRNTDSQKTDKLSPMQLKDLIIKRLQQLDQSGGEEKKGVERKDEDTIDLVALLFQFLVEDRNLPDKIQVMLARLQLPYLQLALKDRRIFTDKQFPARSLLDQIAKSSIGWTEEHDRKNQYINEVKRIVDTILNNEEDEIDYEELLEDFIDFDTKHKKRAEIVEKRTSEKVSGQERVELAKKKTAAIIRNKMQGKKLPDLVRNILVTPWANVLILSHLRESDDPELLKSSTDFVEKIVSACNPKSDSTVTIESITQIVQTLKNGLKLVAYDDVGIRQQSDKILECLLTINELSESDLPAEEVEMIEPEKILEISQEKEQKSAIIEFLNHTENEDKEAPVIEDEHFEAVTNLIKGDWVEFLYDEKGLKAKLSWVSPISSRLLFVNSKGLKVTDKEPYALAHELREAKARILQQIPLFDRALSAIAKQIETDDQPPKGLTVTKLKKAPEKDNSENKDTTPKSPISPKATSSKPTINKPKD